MTTTCPCDGCESVYDCDACLDAHLRQAHDTRYGQVYGAVPQAWIGLCTDHANVPVPRLDATLDPGPAVQPAA